MPPPPPPSKSYLLVITDSDSEDDHDDSTSSWEPTDQQQQKWQPPKNLEGAADDENVRHKAGTEEPPPVTSVLEKDFTPVTAVSYDEEEDGSVVANVSMSVCTEDYHDDDDEEEEEEDCDDGDAATTATTATSATTTTNTETQNKRKKKNKKKKRKKNKKSVSPPSEGSSPDNDGRMTTMNQVDEMNDGVKEEEAPKTATAATVGSGATAASATTLTIATDAPSNNAKANSNSNHNEVKGATAEDAVVRADSDTSKMDDLDQSMELLQQSSSPSSFSSSSSLLSLSALEEMSGLPPPPSNIQVRPIPRRRQQQKVPAQQPLHHRDSRDDHNENGFAMKMKVRFGTCQVRYHGRTLGSDVVPGEGGWPLGLSNDVLVPRDSTATTTQENDEDVLVSSVDEYEASKHVKLKQRWNLLVLYQMQQQRQEQQQQQQGRTRSSANASNAFPISSLFPMKLPDWTLPTDPPAVLETRQWDYTRKKKNPLFGVLCETERMNLLLAYSEDDDDIANDTDDEDDENSLAKSSGSHHKSSSNKRRSFKDRRMDSVRSTDSVRSSGGNSHASSKDGEFFNATFSQKIVHQVRNELQEIRQSRTAPGRVGCTCRKLVVFVNNGGKKGGGHQRRLKPSKVKDELRKRNLLPDNHENSNGPSREQLEAMLHKAVEKEPCCSNSDCYCVRNGIECQADACSCWYPSHQGKQQHSSSSGSKKNDDRASLSTSTAGEIKRRCGNKYGMNVVDLDKIDQFRENMLCQVIESSLWSPPPDSKLNNNDMTMKTANESKVVSGGGGGGSKNRRSSKSSGGRNRRR